MNSFEEALRAAVEKVRLETAIFFHQCPGSPTSKLSGVSLYGAEVTASMMRLLHIKNFASWFDDIEELLLTKNSDYGKNNIQIYGVNGVRVRLDDKIARFINLYNNSQTPQHEALVDTLVDTIGYTIIGYMVEQGWWELPHCKEPSTSLKQRLIALETAGS